MPKSKDAFRTISEVAEWLETPAHVLRFWESKFTQVKPMKRAGGRRYYRPTDMQLLGGIKKLLHDDGLAIKGAQKLLREHGVKHVAALSQPLEDDLLNDESIVQEAAYEPDAQPELQVETPATVLSFPSRTQPKKEKKKEPTVLAEAISAEPEPKESRVEIDTEVLISDDDDYETLLDRAGDAPAFGNDALPAFLRRSPAPPAQDDEEIVETTEVAAESTSPFPSSEKISINSTPYFESVETAEEASVEEVQVESKKRTGVKPEAPQPIFGRSLATYEIEQAQSEPQTTEPEHVEANADTSIEPTPQKSALDVLSIAKVAPTLESYTANPGVLAALPCAHHISPELAYDLSAYLAKLRALRDGMQNH